MQACRSTAARSALAPLVFSAVALWGLCLGVAGAPDVAADKSDRLAADRAQLEELLERQQSAPGRDEALASVRKRIAASDAKSVPFRNYLQMNDGWVKGSILRFLDGWNTPPEPDAVPPALDWTATDHPKTAIVDFARQLEEHDIELLVVPIPTRLDVYADRLLVREPPGGFVGYDSGTTALLLELNAAGVEVLSLVPAFVESRDADPENSVDSLYLRYNHHWTPRAAEIAAELIAARVLASSSIERGPAREGEDFFFVEEAVDWTPKRVEEYMPDFGPERLHVRRVLDDQGEHAAAWDRESPLVVLGDSFAIFFRDESADLLSHLYARLGFSVDAVAIAGSAARATRGALRRRGDDLAGKRYVVWTFAVTAFQYDEWKKIDVFGE